LANEACCVEQFPALRLPTHHIDFGGKVCRILHQAIFHAIEGAGDNEIILPDSNNYL